MVLLHLVLCQIAICTVSILASRSRLRTSNDQYGVCTVTFDLACLRGWYPFDLDVCNSGVRQATAITRRQRSQRHAAVAASQAHYVGSLSASNLKFAVIVARFNDLITKPLLSGALEAFERHGGDTSNADVSSAGLCTLSSCGCC